MPLVYLPDDESLFLWSAEREPRLGAVLTGRGEPSTALLVTPEGRRAVDGERVALLDAVTALSAVRSAAVPTLSASVAVWVLASKVAVELVARERVVPTIARRRGRLEARWAAALAAPEDAARVTALARSMPPAAHAAAASADGALEVWSADALLRAFMDAVVDALVRAARGAPELVSGPARRRSAQPWDERFRAALTGEHPGFEPQGFAERSVTSDLERWSAPAVGARDRLRACFRLEPPDADRAPFQLRFLLQSPDDPSLLVAAAEVWATRGRNLEKLGRAFRDPQESLLEALGRAARVYPPLAEALSEATPEALALDPAEAWTFLGTGAPALVEAGFGVVVPGELTASGRRRLRLRARVGGKAKVAGAVSGAAGLGLDELLAVDWQAVIGDQTLSPRELAALARQKSPLVRFRGAWVAVDPRELADIQQRMQAGPGQMALRDAVRAALAGETTVGSLSASVTASGALSGLLERLRGAEAASLPVPETLAATLRPYQERGLRWLATLGSIGLGACLADDMGLGKTIQLLAYLLHRDAAHPNDDRPALLVAPTSVIGNWEREVARFAPSLCVVPHYGPERLRRPGDFPARRDALVLTTYGLLRRDAELLAAVPFAVVALDEAQNIKNAASATARAARGLRAEHRVALTGTPVENRLAELWSILEFANPGLLGPLERFRRDYAIPIERYGNEEAAERLRRVASPFVLRRLKSDPNIVQDLPPKNEMKVLCTLTREQATLYKAVVDEEMRRIGSAEGVERKGRVLALLTFTKQILNHPAQYLGERGPLPRRSGKLARLTEMLEEAVASGDRALVFTQFREMGDKLADHLGATLGCGVVFLHGGTPKRARDEMVRRFQEDPHGPSIFVLSVKAGGTGLNLTAASHVFHYDRWWNPAVEDQATDRAYRIGQKRAVQVHKLLCAGTVEEKIDRLLEHKRALASKVVGTGEKWITELGTDELSELFALSGGAAALEEDTEEGTPAPPRKARKGRARRGEASP